MYRETLAQDIYRFVRTGESALLVGASGSGKSFFVKDLIRAENVDRFLKLPPNKLFIIFLSDDELANGTALDFYRLFLNRLIDRVRTSGLIFEVLAEEQIYEAEKEIYLLEKLRTLLRLVTESQIIVWVIIDDLEELLQKFDASFFSSLKNLRDINRDLFTYLVLAQNTEFTAETLRKIAPFFKLVSSNILYLPTLTNAESLLRLKDLAKQKEIDLEDKEVRFLSRLTGGYPSLMRICLYYLDKNRHLTEEEFVRKISVDPGLILRLEEIFQGLAPLEKEYLLARSKGRITKELEIEAKLKARGLINEKDEIFSPIFLSYLKQKLVQASSPIAINQKAEANQTVFIDARTRRVFKNGQELANISKQEYRLLNFLYINPEKIVSRDEVAEAVWEASISEGISEEAIDQLVTRLRGKIEDDKSNPQHLLTVRGRGFSFRT